MAQPNEENDANPTMGFQHQGDHHAAKIAFDPKTNEVSAGGIYNFSDNAGAMLQIHDGKVEGTIAHSGDTHHLNLMVQDDGKFEGTYTDCRHGEIEIIFKGGIATLTKGEIPEGGIRVQGDHHSLKLERGSNGKLCGAIESRKVPNGVFQIAIDDGKISGKITCKGDSHQTTFILGAGGCWGAEVALGKGNKAFTFSIAKGRGGEVTGSAGLKLKF